jgi:hypothetical protein
MNIWDFLKWRCGKNSYESVYFYTFHKCASTLFSRYILKNIEDLRHVDYAEQIYSGRNIPITFKEKGCVYGPIRLSAQQRAVYETLVHPTSRREFVRDKIAIFMVRDPRDILVSAYHSFGYSHSFSPVQEIRERQAQLRMELQSKTIDEYALERAARVRANFETLDTLRQACERCVVLRYEDMINEWQLFVSDLTKYINIKPAVLAQIYEKSRPREKEDKSSHRRSGQVGDFSGKLKTETIITLNGVFAAVLKRFQYDP